MVHYMVPSFQWYSAYITKQFRLTVKGLITFGFLITSKHSHVCWNSLGPLMNYRKSIISRLMCSIEHLSEILKRRYLQSLCLSVCLRLDFSKTFGYCQCLSCIDLVSPIYPLFQWPGRFFKEKRYYTCWRISKLSHYYVFALSHFNQFH